MSFIDWGASPPATNDPSQIPHQVQQSALAGYQLGQTGAMYSALRNVDLSNIDSVNRAMSGLASIGMVDLAKGTSNLAVQRAINTPIATRIGGAINQGFDQGQGQGQGAQPPPQAPGPSGATAGFGPAPVGSPGGPPSLGGQLPPAMSQADFDAKHKQLLQQAADAANDLASTADPVLRQSKADAYRATFAAEGVPQAHIDEVLGDLSPQGLQAHADYLTDQASGGGGNVPHPTGYAATQQLLASSPELVTAQRNLTGPFANPVFMAAMAANGYNVEPGLNLAANITSPVRQAATQAAFAPTISYAQAQGAAAGGGSIGSPPVAGARLSPDGQSWVLPDGTTQTVQQVAQAQATGQARVGNPPVPGAQLSADGQSWVLPNGTVQAVQRTHAAAAVGAAATQTYSYPGADGAMHAMNGAQLLNPDGSFKSNVTDAAGNRVTDANGALQVSLSPETNTMLTTTAQGEGERAQQLQSAFEGSSQRKAILQDLTAAASGDTTTGPGAAKWADYTNEFNRIFGTHFASNQAATTQTINKMAEMIAQTQISAGGLPRSNAGLESTELTSPGANYSPETIQRLAGVLQGNEDYIQKKQALWQAYQQQAQAKGLPASYNTFVGEFNKYYDPRTFWEPHMTPAQLAQMQAGMSPAERARYQQGKTTAAAVDKFFGVQ